MVPAFRALNININPYFNHAFTIDGIKLNIGQSEYIISAVVIYHSINPGRSTDPKPIFCSYVLACLGYEE